MPIEISVAGLKTPTGWCFNAFLHDISDRRRADRLTDQFLAMVSHELRTPLASIVAHVELLLEEDGAELPATVRRGFLDVIGRNSVRLERLVGDLLFVAQLESAHLTLSMQPVDVAEIAAHAVGAASPRARQQGIAFALHTDGPVWLSGDRDRLGQTLDNLISNAVHYSPDGGTISVRVAAAGGLAVLEVGDEGIGIPEDEQARVFDRFFRASSAAELHVQGVGLGLLIVRTIVQGHGGDISLTSRPGEGTTFRVELPIVPAHASTHQ